MAKTVKNTKKPAGPAKKHQVAKKRIAKKTVQKARKQPKPKGAMNAWNCFLYSMYEKVKAENKDDTTLGNVSAYCRPIWDAFTEEEREQYKRMAVEDAARYEREMAMLTDEQRKLIEREEKRSKTAKRRANPITRARTAYIYFFTEERKRLVNSNSDVVFDEIGRVIGQKWRDLTDAEKAPYESKALADKVRYERDCKAFKAYSEEFEKVFRAETPRITRKELRIKLGTTWKNMSENERAKYY